MTLKLSLTVFLDQRAFGKMPANAGPAISSTIGQMHINCSREKAREKIEYL